MGFNKKAYRLSFLVAIFLLGTALAFASIPSKKATPPSAEAMPDKVLVITINGIINPVSSEYITKSIKEANEEDYQAFVIELDTPGGLMDSMRDIIKSILGSEVPVIVYVSPAGARAASAGAFITISAHVAAMAPETNIGSAHPVAGGGGKMDEVMSAKVTNDAVAYIKSLAKRHGRNEAWAEDAVRNSISSTAAEALDENVIDIISPSLSALLMDIHGRTVKTTSGDVTFNTKEAEVERKEMSLRYKILDKISNPNIAYLLMMLGFYGLFFEMTNPGSIFPGVVGGISLILAFYALQTLPVNYAGLLLILLGIVLFILETQTISYGALTIGGVVSMFFGSVMLFDKGGPLFRVSIILVLVATLSTAMFFVLAMGLVVKAYKRRPVTGNEGLIGVEGRAKADFSANEGMTFVRGELWTATSDDEIAKDDKVEVVEVEGLKLKVKKIIQEEQENG